MDPYPEHIALPVGRFRLRFQQYAHKFRGRVRQLPNRVSVIVEVGYGYEVAAITPRPASYRTAGWKGSVAVSQEYLGGVVAKVRLDQTVCYGQSGLPVRLKSPTAQSSGKHSKHWICDRCLQGSVAVTSKHADRPEIPGYQPLTAQEFATATSECHPIEIPINDRRRVLSPRQNRCISTERCRLRCPRARLPSRYRYCNSVWQCTNSLPRHPLCRRGEIPPWQSTSVRIHPSYMSHPARKGSVVGSSGRRARRRASLRERRRWTFQITRLLPSFAPGGEGYQHGQNCDERSDTTEASLRSWDTSVPRNQGPLVGFQTGA